MMKWPGKLSELLRPDRHTPAERGQPLPAPPDPGSTQNLDLVLNPSTARDLESQIESTSASQALQPPPTRPVSDRSRDRSLLKALLNSLYDAVLILDERGNVTATNARAASFFKFPESELWGMSIHDLITGFNALVLNKISDHVATGRFTVIHANCMQKDGALFPAEIAISRIHYLNDTDILMTIRNQKRRKASERKQMLERDAAAYTATGLLICNPDGIIEYANRRGIDLLRHNDGDGVVGQSIRNYCKDPMVDNILRPDDEAGRWTGKVSFNTGSSPELRCLLTGSVMPDAKDDKSRIVISFTPEALAGPSTQ